MGRVSLVVMRIRMILYMSRSYDSGIWPMSQKIGALQSIFYSFLTAFCCFKGYIQRGILVHLYFLDITEGKKDYI